MFRAVPIFEHCILGQVSLVSAMERMDSFSRRLLLVTLRKWFRARALFASLADAEYDFAVYPQTSSVEANRLLVAAQYQFGLSNALSVEVPGQFRVDRPALGKRPDTGFEDTTPRNWLVHFHRA